MQHWSLPKKNEIGKEYMEEEGGLTGIGRLERKQRVTGWVAGVRRSRSAAAPRAGNSQAFLRASHRHSRGASAGRCRREPWSRRPLGHPVEVHGSGSHYQEREHGRRAHRRPWGARPEGGTLREGGRREARRRRRRPCAAEAPWIVPRRRPKGWGRGKGDRAGSGCVWTFGLGLVWMTWLAGEVINFIENCYRRFENSISNIFTLQNWSEI
jgi:hypothetical protein